ncbi:MAG TPA: SH3 domain-containing protein [Chloroflexota bacterium]|nr:SH3 domain-containing protein [Chloroflexota bacterium]
MPEERSAPPLTRVDTIRRTARAAVLLAAALLPAARAGAGPGAQPAGIEATVVSDQELNVRAGPGLAQPVLTTLRPGARVLIVRGPIPADGWTWCEHTGWGGQGWSVCEALATAQELRGLLAEAPATPPGAEPTPPPATPTPPRTPTPVVVRPPPLPPMTPVRLPPPRRAVAGTPGPAAVSPAASAPLTPSPNAPPP